MIREYDSVLNYIFDQRLKIIKYETVILFTVTLYFNFTKLILTQLKAELRPLYTDIA